MTKIIIERSSEWNNKARKIGIYIDGEKVGVIDDGETKTYEVTPGTHEVFAKIDWCGSKKIEINIQEYKARTLKLSGFKYGAWILPIILSFYAIYYLLTFVFEMQLKSIVWIPLLVILYPIYFITFGKNNYLRLTKRNI